MKKILGGDVMKKYIIALDQGTTSSRAIIFNKQHNIHGIEQKEITQIFKIANCICAQQFLDLCNII